MLHLNSGKVTMMENFPEIDDHFRLRQLRVWVRGRIWIFRAFCPFSSSLALFLAAPLFCAYFYSRNSPPRFLFSSSYLFILRAFLWDLRSSVLSRIDFFFCKFSESSPARLFFGSSIFGAESSFRIHISCLFLATPAGVLILLTHEHVFVAL